MMNKVCKLSTDFLFLHEYREIRKRKLVVMCHGCFDVLHYGHLIHLNSARAKGDYLIVSLAGDAFVNKGTGKPVFDQYKRAAMLAAFSIIDRVVITETLGPFEHIKALRPHFYEKGPDYDDATAPEADLVRQCGGEIVFTENSKDVSSSDILKCLKETA